MKRFDAIVKKVLEVPASHIREPLGVLAAAHVLSGW